MIITRDTNKVFLSGEDSLIFTKSSNAFKIKNKNKGKDIELEFDNFTVYGNYKLTLLDKFKYIMVAIKYIFKM